LKEKMKFFLICIAVILTAVIPPVSAGIVSKIDVSENQIEKDKEFSITLQFASNTNAIACGLQIDWGDGSIERFRVGEGQQVQPPYKINHTYSSANTFKVRINGELLIRGLRSLPPCEVKREGSISVIDPVEFAKQNELKAAAEKQRQARIQAEAQERQIQQAQMAAQAEEQRKLKQVEIEIALKNASLKTCDQFIEAFKSRYRYSYDWPELKCNFSSDNNAAFVIDAYNKSRAQYGASAYSKFYYQPKTETVLGISGRGSQTTYNVKNFIDIAKVADINASGEIEMDNVPPEEQKIVCDRVDKLVTNFANQHEFRIAAGFEAAEVAKAGNWNFLEITNSRRGCIVRINVAGTYQGNSLRKNLSCKIGKVIKRVDGKYTATSIAFEGGACL
jgi:hypothetical protein